MAKQHRGQDTCPGLPLYGQTGPREQVHGSLEGPKRDQISGPVWLIATDILVRHEQAPFDTEVQSALLSAFAHLGIAGSSPVQPHSRSADASRAKAGNVQCRSW